MVIIEQAKRDDISEIVGLDREAFGEQGISKETIESQFNAFPKGIFVAKKSDKLLGVVCCEKHKKEKFPPYNHNVGKTHSKTGNFIYLSVITIAEEFRNKNIGSLLLEKVSELGNKSGIKKIYLPVNKKHPYLEKGVLGFWQKNCYQIIGETNWEISPDRFIDSYILETLLQ